jgi:hypothetical protein
VSPIIFLMVFFFFLNNLDSKNHDRTISRGKKSFSEWPSSNKHWPMDP